jgi:hypothetical protein
VEALYQGDESSKAGAPLFTIQASPVVLPRGWVGSSINERVRTGSVIDRPASGEIILRGSGGNIWDKEDGFYFLHRVLSGDFQITVKMRTKPTAVSDWAQAGLMVRETLDADARHSALVTTRAHGIQFKWRASTHDITPTWLVPRTEALRLPVLLRLTRQGNIITPEYSTNDGKTFQAAGDPYPFEVPLPQSVHAGLAITAHEVGEVAEARFSHLQVQKR